MAPAKGATVSDDRDPGLGDDDLDVPDTGGGDDLLESIESTDGDLTTADGEAGIDLGRRLFGMLGMVLGILGCLVALYLAFSSLRLLFGASDRAEDRMAPVAESFDRMEDRIDQADDLVDRRGIEADGVPELRARVDGLVDIATSAEQSFDAVDDHPLYSLLPADLSPLGDALARFRTSAEVVDEAMGTSSTVRASAAGTMADELDGMQSAVSDTRDDLDDATGSLRRWLRIGGLLGFLASLWVLWSQVTLARRGWRGVRNRAL